VDRFMLKLRVGYPTKDQERRIVDRMAASAPPIDIEPVVTLDEVRRCRAIVDKIHLDDRLRDYIIEVVHATREPKAHKLEIGRLIEFGASPRASIALAQAGRARAFLDGRAFVTPTDIKLVAPDVLRHRVVVSYEAEAEDVTSDDVVRTILDHVPTP